MVLLFVVTGVLLGLLAYLHTLLLVLAFVLTKRHEQRSTVLIVQVFAAALILGGLGYSTVAFFSGDSSLGIALITGVLTYIVLMVLSIWLANRPPKKKVRREMGAKSRARLEALKKSIGQMRPTFPGLSPQPGAALSRRR